ncbi:hypothetical protein [Hoeflea ulvae]|uniref:Uncharacterized protein n=1 Tax=Hoeflea ulvae TaxID=2983764 RepID=A0ABT3YG72_9HYPH|nr:hypothetical protein [Hoeflea ulvae]MCY0094900.1 hypothetical protein [Hoeflea ulvae]
MTSPKVTAGTLEPGQIQFYDNLVPRLHDGSFTITVSQTVTGATNDTYSANQKFDVNGPRFSIDGNLVQAQFPPSTHTGRFEEQLPHIVLKKPALPWERFLNPDDPNAPWMGVILLSAGTGAAATASLSGGGVSAVTLTSPGAGYEIAPNISFQGGGGTGARAMATVDSSGAVVGITVTAPGSGYTSEPTVKIGTTTNAVTATVGDLLDPGNDSSGTPIAHTGLELNPDFDKTTDLCQIIDIPTSVFSMVTPVYDPANGTDELQFSAHVRQVDTGDKSPQGMKPANGWFSVLIAKRFPQAPGRVPNRLIAHLVSFEGFADKMTGSPDWGGAQMVRLNSLVSWTFTCLPAIGETFAELMRDLMTTEDNTEYLLRPRYRQPGATLDGTAAKAQETLELGYLPMPYQTRQGEHSFAFYRGPLSPVVPPVFDDTPPLNSPSASVIYNPDWGLFDQSYAVAFQTGRLMALSNRTFGSNLLQWRREGHQMTNILVNRLTPSAVNALMQDRSGVAVKARAVLEADVVSDGLMAWLVGDLASKVAPRLAASSPPPDDLWAGFTADKVSDPDDVIAELQGSLTNPDMQHLLQDLGGWDRNSRSFTDTRFQNICEWLAELALLENMPFNNLVPTASMLPAGSIRFFYIDRNIIHALIDGAMSVAGQSSRDTLYFSIMRDVIRDAVYSILHQVRQKVMGKMVTPPSRLDQPISGFLLRSAAVSGWPGLEVKGFRTVDTSGDMPEGKGQIPLLRMAHLNKDILLVLFPEIPAWVQIAEPKEGLAFGIEDGAGANKAPVWVRHLIGNNVGGQFGTDPATDAVDASPAINASNGTIDLLQMRSLLAANPGLAGELPLKTYSKGTLSPGDFALQMVKLPERMIFQAQS